MLNKSHLQVKLVSDASGAYYAGKTGDVVIIVDVIDMSTTLECAIEAGSIAVYGAAPDHVKPPVPVDPEKIGYKVGKESVCKNASIILVSEPRWGTENDMKKNAQKVVRGIERAGGIIERFIPNLGLTTVKLHDFNNKLTIGVTDTGGTAFDTALNSGGLVLTGTIARTTKYKGVFPALIAAKRAVGIAQKMNKNISVVAASANSLEDILAAQYIAQKILELIRS
jgi:hypothetical protein